MENLNADNFLQTLNFTFNEKFQLSCSHFSIFKSTLASFLETACFWHPFRKPFDYILLDQFWWLSHIMEFKIKKSKWRIEFHVIKCHNVMFRPQRKTLFGCNIHATSCIVIALGDRSPNRTNYLKPSLNRVKCCYSCTATLTHQLQWYLHNFL